MTNTNPSPSLDRFLSWSLRRTIATPTRYALATLLTVVVGVFRGLLVTAIVPWLLFIPVVLGIALALGRNPGLDASVLSAINAGVSIGSAAHTFWLTEPQWIGSILFVLVAAGIAMLAAELRAAFARVQASGALLAEREAFLSSVLASSTDCIKVLDLDARLTFGTGYASLNLLRDFPVTRLKIDHGFVVEVGGPSDRSPLVESVLTLGRAFGLAVVAEGVETEMQANWLRSRGCAEAQGWLFGRPVPAAQFPVAAASGARAA